MRTNNKKKLLGAVAVAGIVAASGSAFTATGLSNNASPTTFVGGTVHQTVTGAATLDTIAYTYSTTAQTSVSKVTLTFAAISAGSAVSVTLNGGPETPWTCTETGVAKVYDCTGTPFVGLDDLAVTVAEA